ncbi:response regulator [Desmospora profundinema]|uniref:Transcriptional regulatory protein n=1 Tax=Desmospora profundinema TaxID=1571184 RepID=A0ABU1IRF2_9BACL|nr:response regulator [Desmospora profundinema]MDR6227303.1 CitB family two-component system response regulator MalR [Desmospora profundinema]
MIQVLIVEDDPMVAEINRRYVESIEGFTCVGIVSGVSDALHFLESHAVDLVLLDIFMPGKNGLEFLSEIRKKGSSVGVIVISAASDIANIKTALRLGAVDYLIKPFEFQRLQAAFRAYQREHQLLSEQEELTQDKLDQLLLHPANQPASRELPKGLTKETLQRVVKAISTMGDDFFSTEKLADQVGVSRVSMRKYLKFLTELGYLSLDLHYRPAGRPLHLYRMQKSRAEVLKPYLEAAD